MTTTAMSPTDHRKAVLEARLQAAWLERCGPTGDPGVWMAGEVLEVDRDGDIEVSVYPMFAVVDADGKPRMWSASLDPSEPDVRQGWEWRLGGVDDRSPDDLVEQLEELGGALDRWHVSLLVLGDHKEKPPLSETVLQAYELIWADEPS